MISLIKIALKTPVLTDKNVRERFWNFSNGMRNDRKALMFYPLYFAKNLVYIFLFVLLNVDYAFYMSMGCVAIQIVFILIILIIRPFGAIASIV